MEPRHRRIVDYLRHDGHLSVDELTARLGVTPQTIRRDLRALTRGGHVIRACGIAMAVDTGHAGPHARQAPAAPGTSEQRLCDMAAAQLPGGSALLLGSGDVAAWTAAALLRCAQRGLRVVTHNLQVAMLLGDGAPSSDSYDMDIEVIVAGGVLRRRDAATVGACTLAFLRDFRADVAIVGIDGVASDGALLVDDLDGASVLRAIVEQARHVWLVADHSRFLAARGMARIGDVGQMARIFTNAPLPPHIAAMCGHCVVAMPPDART